MNILPQCRQQIVFKDHVNRNWIQIYDSKCGQIRTGRNFGAKLRRSIANIVCAIPFWQDDDKLWLVHCTTLSCHSSFMSNKLSLTQDRKHQNSWTFTSTVIYMGNLWHNKSLWIIFTLYCKILYSSPRFNLFSYKLFRKLDFPKWTSPSSSSSSTCVTKLRSSIFGALPEIVLRRKSPYFCPFLFGHTVQGSGHDKSILLNYLYGVVKSEPHWNSRHESCGPFIQSIFITVHWCKRIYFDFRNALITFVEFRSLYGMFWNIFLLSKSICSLCI